MPYSDKFDEAITLAIRVHKDQHRKGTGVPYITHILGVASIVGGHGGTEAQVIGALLHDAIEDGVEQIPDIADKIGARFGEHVLEIDRGVSDTEVHPKPPWKERKQAYVTHVQEAAGDDTSLLVSVSDKLHNARSIRRDLNLVGLEIFDRFKATRDQTLWYYRTLSDAFSGKAFPTPLQQQVAAALGAVVSDMEAEVTRLLSADAAPSP